MKDTIVKRSNGFTLIELIIILAIVVILAALIIPYFQNKGLPTVNDSGVVGIGGSDTPQGSMYLPDKGQYKVDNGRGTIYITEFSDKHGHHCLAGVHSGSLEITCQGH